MSLEQYGIRQDGMFVAKVDIPADRSRFASAFASAMHYLNVYAQDGPVELWKRSKHRKWKRVTGREYRATRRAEEE